MNRIEHMALRNRKVERICGISLVWYLPPRVFFVCVSSFSTFPPCVSFLNGVATRLAMTGLMVAGRPVSVRRNDISWMGGVSVTCNHFEVLDNDK